MRWSWTVSFWNVHLKGAESKSLHDWAEPRGLHVENQTLFQALPSSSSGAADVQGSSKAPPANLHVRTANLLTFCHSLTYAAHKTHTHVSMCRITQDVDSDTCTKLTFSKKPIYTRPSSLISLSVHFSAESTQFLFSSLSFPSVQQLGKIQHVLAVSENSFI